jgi:hypothetical protein
MFSVVLLFASLLYVSNLLDPYHNTYAQQNDSLLIILIFIKIIQVSNQDYSILVGLLRVSGYTLSVQLYLVVVNLIFDFVIQQNMTNPKKGIQTEGANPTQSTTRRMKGCGNF